MATHQDLTKLTHEQLVALIIKERQEAKGPSIAWAKDREGAAVNITFPGKRSRYLEVEELEWLIEHGASLIEKLITD